MYRNLLKRSFTTFNREKHVAKVQNYFIDFPKLSSAYNDKVITKYLKRALPDNCFDEIANDIQCFANAMESQHFNLHLDCETNQPVLQKFDAWGKRVDKLITCSAWKTLKSLSAKEGLVAIPYERKHGQFSRIHQCIKLLIFNPLGGLYSCPLAMTDGAAFVLERLGKPEPLKHAFENLISRKPELFWTSGQWMTEKGGGSDVSGATDTIAIFDSLNNCYRLFGNKWFSSATDSDMSFTLARSLDKDGKPISGGKGLSLYYLETKSSDKDLVNEWNYLEVVNMKNKLGTRQLPTAELLLNGSKALKMSEDGRGVQSISGMLTITRIHNAIAATSAMRRILLLAIEYAKSRKCFGSLLIENSLHVLTLAEIDMESRAAFYVLMNVVELLGRLENSEASKEETEILRILCPLLKLYTAKQAVSCVSEGLECFGGQGYIEDTGLPAMLRDAQVLPIWEGTTNVLSLDFLRALKLPDRENSGSFKLFTTFCRKKLRTCSQNKNSLAIETLELSLDCLDNFLQEHANDLDTLQIHARQVSFAAFRIYAGILLAEAASFNDCDASDELVLSMWMQKDLTVGLRNRVDRTLLKSCFD